MIYHSSFVACEVRNILRLEAMSEGQSSGEKTEMPTPKRLRDSRKKGQVARSQEVVTTATLFSVIGYLWLVWGILVQNLVGLMDSVAALARYHDHQIGESTLYSAIYISFMEIVYILAPILLIVIVVAIFANCIQFGVLFATEAIKPKLEKISLIKGAKRIFSMKQVVELLKSIVKICFLSLLLYVVVKSAIGQYLTAFYCGFPCLMQVTASMLGRILFFSALAFALIAILDLLYQRHSHTKSLKMTKDEVKREYKQTEGDPLIKGERRQLAQELIMNDEGTSARQSSAVVTNPTHYAVAILYDEARTPLPVVVAKGQNMRAHFIRTEAEEAGVPIFRNPPLAQKLFAEVERYQFIPDELVTVVAEILVWISFNKDALYQGPLNRGVIEMDDKEAWEKEKKNAAQSAGKGMPSSPSWRESEFSGGV